MQITNTTIDQESDPVIAISFDTEDDRVRGFGILAHSNYGFKGIGKNKFIIKKGHYALLQSKNIKFQEI